MNPAVKKWAKFVIRWTIAAVGIGYVLLNTPLYDTVTIVGQAMMPVKARLVSAFNDDAKSVEIHDPQTWAVREVPRSDLVNKPDTKTVIVRDGSITHKRKLLALDLSDDLKTVQRFLVEKPDGTGEWVMPDQVEKYQLGVPYPLVDQGIIPMLRQADKRFLWASILIFPLTFLITGFRWYLLLRAIDISISPARAFVINMVGAFYNTFMPGSTGGDVVKAYYAAKNVPLQRTRAVMSVIIDRAIGLLALIILGGTMAAYLALTPHQVGDAVAQHCARIAIAALVIIVATISGLTVLYVPLLRRITGLDFILRKLPMQPQVQKAVHTMELYRRSPWLVFWALIMTFPVHITVIFSAMFAGMAFNLPISPGYYWVVVPVVVLAGAIPISPQGAGVMEFFAILLTRRQNCTVSQAFVLTMSIRLVQMFWNVALGAYYYFRGGYRAPTEKEQEQLENSDDTASK